MAHWRDPLISLATLLPIIATGAAAEESHGAATMTIAQAQALDSQSLSLQVMRLLGDQVADVEGPPPAGAPGTEGEFLEGISLALKPRTGWNGVCSATILDTSFEDPPAGAGQGVNTPQRIESVAIRTLYKIRGPLDQNLDQDDESFATLCARDRPFKDNYFTAPNDLAAQEAGLILQAAATQAEQGQLRFRLGCDDARDCSAARELLPTLKTEHLTMVTERDHCPGDTICLDLMLWAKAPCARTLRTWARYRGIGPRGYGLVRLERMRLGREQCPGPAM